MTRALDPGPDGGDALDDAAAAMRLVATMVWPEHETRQRHAVATWAAMLVAWMTEEMTPDRIGEHLEDHVVAGAARFGVAVADLDPALHGAATWMREHVTAFAAASAGDIMQSLLIPAGGLGAVAHAPGVGMIYSEMNKAIVSGPGLAGMMLYTLAAMERHHGHTLPSVSLNRAAAIMEGRGRSLRLMKEAWRRHRVASHLWAGMLATLGAAAEADDARAVLAAIETRAGRARLLAYAAWFADWGCRHIVAGAARPVLDGVALVPIAREPAEPPLEPLAPAAVERARRYRAPKEVW